MKVVKLILVSAFLSGCLTTPGMQEPWVQGYVILSDGSAECLQCESCCAKRKLEPDELIGYQCVSPRQSAELNSHHEVLHHALNGCMNPAPKQEKK